MDTIENSKKDEIELKFTIACLYYQAKFMFKFYSRLDKLILFILMVLAIIAITGTSNVVFIGSVSAILIFVLIVSQPGAKSQASKTLYHECFKLCQDFDNRDITTIKRQLKAIREKNLEKVASLAYPAQATAAHDLGITSDNGYKGLHRKLSPLEKLYVLFIGETIEYEFKKESNPVIQAKQWQRYR